MANRMAGRRATGRLSALTTHLTASESKQEKKAFDGLTEPAPPQQQPEPGSYVWPSGGLFIDDYSTLPQPTTDMVVAKRDMDLYGYCILANMPPQPQLTRLLDKLLSQADQVQQILPAPLLCTPSLRSLCLVFQFFQFSSQFSHVFSSLVLLSPLSRSGFCRALHSRVRPGQLPNPRINAE